LPVRKTIGIVVVAALAACTDGVVVRSNYGHLPANEVGCQLGQAIICRPQPASGPLPMKPITGIARGRQSKSRSADSCGDGPSPDPYVVN
jgi:hypothetical protein